MNCQSVWLLFEPRHYRDLSTAQGYGSLEVVLTAKDPEPSLSPNAALAVMRERMEDVADGDYIVFAGGDPYALYLAGRIAEERGIEHVRFLRWDRRTDAEGNRTQHGYYTPVEFDTGGNTGDNTETAF